MKQPDFDKTFYLKPCIDDRGFVRLYDPETGRVLGGQQDTGVDNVRLDQPLGDLLTAEIRVIVDPRFVNQNLDKNET